jgi:Uma2 family endonuclease
MSAVVIEETIFIPEWVKNHASFRRWARSDDFPDRGWVSYLQGEVWVDMSPEELFTHNQVKGVFAIFLGYLIQTCHLGRYWHDRALLSNGKAGLSTEPDGLFISRETLKAKRIQFVRGKRGYVEIHGTPDMVLEVVSDSSVKKDTKKLRELYWKAGIPEYWLVDSRGEPLSFDILRHTPNGYLATRWQSGWLPSKVFGKSFQLTRQPDEFDFPEYTLAIR